MPRLAAMAPEPGQKGDMTWAEKWLSDGDYYGYLKLWAGESWRCKP